MSEICRRSSLFAHSSLIEPSDRGSLDRRTTNTDPETGKSNLQEAPPWSRVLSLRSTLPSSPAILPQPASSATGQDSHTIGIELCAVSRHAMQHSHQQMDDVQMDSVQPSTAPETHRLDCAYVDADSGASDESDHEPTKEPKRAGRKRELSKTEPKNAEPKKPASKKAKRSHSEQRQFDNCRDVRQAVTRNVPSLRTQRKHLDENGMPLSVVAVRRQMTSDVLPNHQKQYFQSKDYSEDGRETFEKVRMMFINNLKAKEYFDHKVYTDLVNKEEIQSEEANRRRLEGDYEDGESSADAGVDEGCPGKTAADLSEGSGSESEYENSELPGLEHRRMHRGIYKPEQMKEGMKEAIKGAY